MDTKLQVLTRGGGARTAPRVVFDSSLSMSFRLPASMSARKPLAPAQATPTPPPTQAPTPTPQVHDEEADDESWEDKDWGASTATSNVNPNANESSSNSAASALRRVVDQTMVLRTFDELRANAATSTSDDDNDDAWEEADAPALPDDFPVLIVNLSRLRDLHFRSEERGGAHSIALDTDEQLREFYATVKRTLHEHFTQMTEVLFEQEICIHTHYGSQRSMLQNLHRAYPAHVFALIDYPARLAGLDLHEYLHVLSTPTRWPSVNYLKDCLRKCSRDLEWKFEIGVELEKLAQQEHAWWTREQQARSDEIDALTRLRDSFRAKLSKFGDVTNSSQYMLLRKLEDIETRLLALIDTYLAEPELTEKESRELMGFADVAPSLQMRNVLDMVVAMIFSRLPRDYGSQPTREAHFGMLLDHHVHIRRLWKRDFGRLPARSTGGAAEQEEEEDGADEEEQQVDVTKLEDDLDQFGVKDEAEQRDDEEYEVQDDWEAIGQDAEEEEQEEEEAVRQDNFSQERGSTGSKPAADVLDGYGADYESDGSSIGNENAASEKTERPAVDVKRAIRRTRRTKAKREAASTAHSRRVRSPSPEMAARVPTQSDHDRALEAFMYATSDSDEREHAQSGGRLLPSHARTGALQLLRQAKENEGLNWS